MSRLRAHFEDRSALVSDRATVEAVERDGAVTITLRPHASGAVGVVLYLNGGECGTIALDDPACAPAELGDDHVADIQAIDYFVDVAVEGRATAFWNNAWPWPGWRRRARRADYEPYA